MVKKSSIVKASDPGHVSPPPGSPGRAIPDPPPPQYPQYPRTRALDQPRDDREGRHGGECAPRPALKMPGASRVNGR
ncbi:MAG: hypothetical protein Q6353_013005 [Candidatus Sigynarchaeum springense]